MSLSVVWCTDHIEYTKLFGYSLIEWFMVFLHYRSQAGDFYMEHQTKPFFK